MNQWLFKIKKVWIVGGD